MSDESDESESVPVKTGETTVLGIDQGAEALLAVLFGWLSGIVFLLVESNNEYVRFNAFQAVLVYAAVFVVGIVSGFIPIIGWMVGLAMLPITFILWFVLLIKAYKGGATGERFKLPIIGDLAEEHIDKLPKL